MDKKIIKAYTEKAENGKLIAIASTETEDRAGDSLAIEKWDLTNFNKNPVLQAGHDYRPQYTIGIAKNIKRNDKKQLQFEPEFHDITPLSRQVAEMYARGILTAWSVGYIDHGESYELLEVSAVAVPANPDAVTTIQKSLDKAMKKSDTDDLGSEVKAWLDETVQKSVIPYKMYPLADEAMAWDGDKEVQKADGDPRILRTIHTWVDTDNPDFDDTERTWYKLPHHKGDGSYETVWRGVAAAMGALLGGRGGVEIPEEHKQGVYNHLANHYKEFDKRIPELRDYSEEEIDEMDEKGWVPDATVTKATNKDAGMIEEHFNLLRADIAAAIDLHEGHMIEAMYGQDKPEDKPQEKPEDTAPQVTPDDNGETASKSVKKGYFAWSEALQKNFDIANEDSEFGESKEFEFLSKFLDCQVKDVYQNEIIVQAAECGSYLAAFKEVLSKFELKDTRRFNWSGTEVPPSYTGIKLNSTKSDTFLTDGVQFFQDEARPFTYKVYPIWGGMVMEISTKVTSREWNNETIEKVKSWVKENSFLKGEIFSLSGEFLDKTEDSWDNLFLEKEVKDRVQNTMAYVKKNGDSFASRGILFAGLPGNGKTKTARTMMNDFNGTFIWVSAKDLSDQGAFAYAFELAKKNAPAILLLEDVDGYLKYNTDIMKTEMDGFKENKGIVTILTSNNPESLPDSLLDRPGRFHDVLNFKCPNPEVRKIMVTGWAGELDEALLDELIEKTEGMSGAHMKELVDYARIIADEENLDMANALLKSLEKVVGQRELISEMRNPIKTQEKNLDIETPELDKGRKEKTKLSGDEIALSLLKKINKQTSYALHMANKGKSRK